MSEMTRLTETAKPVVVPFDVDETLIHTGRVRGQKVEVRGRFLMPMTKSTVAWARPRWLHGLG
jgi:hypothetical protein